MDENTDGRISYHEMKNYLVSLGFDVESLEGDPKALA
jgi:Ca2+-binding EF-hand superfamily protein